MFKKAFTMTELMVALAIIAILAVISIPIARNRMAKADKFSYYVAYSTMLDVSANIISQSEYEYDANDLANVSIEDIWKNKQYVAYEPNKNQYKYLSHLKSTIVSRINNAVKKIIPSTYAFSRWSEPITTGIQCQQCNAGQAITSMGCRAEIKYCKDALPGYAGLSCDKRGGDGYYYCSYKTQNCGDDEYQTNTGACVCKKYNYKYHEGRGLCVCPSGYELATGQFRGNWDYNEGHCVPACPTGKIHNYSNVEQCICADKPEHSYWTNADTCTWSCGSGYVKVSNKCVQENSGSGGSTCSKTKPEHGSLDTSTCTITCDAGFTKSGDNCICNKSKPEHGTLDSNTCTISCDTNFTKSGDSCVCNKSAPDHGYITDSCGYACNSPWTIAYSLFGGTSCSCPTMVSNDCSNQHKNYNSSSCSCGGCVSGYTDYDNNGICHVTCSSGKVWDSSSGSCTCSAIKVATCNLFNKVLNDDCTCGGCKGGFEMVNGACKSVCTSPKTERDSSGNCVCPAAKRTTCSNAHKVLNDDCTCGSCLANYELVNGACVTQCNGAGQYRDASNNCKNCSDVTKWVDYKALAPELCPINNNVCQRFGMIYSASKDTCVMKKTAENLCERIRAEYNITGSDCNIKAETMKNNVSTGFKNQTPHIKLSNGTNIYIASDLVNLTELSDAQNVKDRTAYLVYVDVNGSNKGRGQLYDDVFPFYLAMSGKVIPVYDPNIEGGASSNEHLSLNIIYDDYSSGNRVTKVAANNLDFKDAACGTGYIRSRKYCGGVSPVSQCSDPQKDCRFIVNKPLRFFR